MKPSKSILCLLLFSFFFFPANYINLVAPQHSSSSYQSSCELFRIYSPPAPRILTPPHNNIIPGHGEDQAVRSVPIPRDRASIDLLRPRQSGQDPNRRAHIPRLLHHRAADRAAPDGPHRREPGPENHLHRSAPHFPCLPYLPDTLLLRGGGVHLPPRKEAEDGEVLQGHLRLGHGSSLLSLPVGDRLGLSPVGHCLRLEPPNVSRITFKTSCTPRTSKGTRRSG